MKTYYNLGKEKVFLTTGIYMTTGNISINATCDNGEPYCTLTVNLDKLDDPELAYLNVNLFGIDVEEFFTSNGLAIKVEGQEQKSGHVVYPLYRLNLKKIQGEVQRADDEAVTAGIEAINNYLKGETMNEFNWKDHDQELKDKIEELVKSHNDFVKSDMGKFLSNGNVDFGKEWTYVLWWNDHTKQIEIYDKGNIAEVQELIDFYHFSEARTRVIIRYTGEDVTNQIKFNPFYRDILNDERLKKG